MIYLCLKLIDVLIDVFVALLTRAEDGQDTEDATTDKESQTQDQE